MKFLFLAVNYGTREHALNFVRLFRDARLEHRMALVDNTVGAEHGVLEREVVPRDSVRCFTAPGNLGYLGGVRYAWGLDWVREYQADWIVVSNVDVTFHPDDLAAALSDFDPAATACVAPSIVSQLSGVDLNPHRRTRPSRLRMWVYKLLFDRYWGLVLYTRLSEWLRGRRTAGPRVTRTVEPRPIYAPHGSFFILGRGYFERGGSLEHAPFLFGEEITIAEHARRMGLPVVYLPALRVDHVEHVSTASLPSRKHHQFVRESVRFLKDSYFR